MTSVSQVLRRYGSQYLAKYRDRMPVEQQKVLQAVMRCRTGNLGTVHFQCAQCGTLHVYGKSCGNRHCPLCQSEKSQQWLDSQVEKLLPCPYFLITFTVPPEVRPVMRRHPRECYDALFRASSATLKLLAQDERFVGTRLPGFTGVLHTWGRDLTYHPHIHYVVAGGGVSPDGTEWKASRVNYFVPEKCLSVIFRAKFRDELKAAGLLSLVPNTAWTRSWVVDSEAVGTGASTLKYLAAYTFRAGITENRVTACDWKDSMSEARVILQVRPSGQKSYRPMPLTVEELIRRYLQHVLPSRFQKVRHYGFLHGSQKRHLPRIRWLAALYNDSVIELCRTVVVVTPSRPGGVCSECGGPLWCVGISPGRYELPPTLKLVLPGQTRAPPAMEESPG